MAQGFLLWVRCGAVILLILIRPDYYCHAALHPFQLVAGGAVDIPPETYIVQASHICAGICGMKRACSAFSVTPRSPGGSGLTCRIGLGQFTWTTDNISSLFVGI